MCALHIAWWASPSDLRRPPPWARHPGADCRVFSADTSGRQTPAHGSQPHPLDCGGISHLLWRMCHSAPSRWCNGSTDDCRPRTEQSHPGSCGSGGEGRVHCSFLLASGSSRLPLEWCCHRNRASLAPGLPWLLTHFWLPEEILVTCYLHSNRFDFIHCGILYDQGLGLEHSLMNNAEETLSVLLSLSPSHVIC